PHMTQRISKSMHDGFLSIFVRQSELCVAVARDVFEQRLEDQARNGIEIAGKCFAAEAQSFKWNGTAARKWVGNDGGFVRVRGFDKAASNFQVSGARGVVPIGKLRNEIKEHLPQDFVRRIRAIESLGEKL